ncbi:MULTISPECIES: hypothetical protein [Streptomyces]|uniref:Integral membrane protein n=1 Tax=Streptomyces glycanivorans TaxID=3033808 RepID=A0ABY9JNN3_9ACTN|nr:MULTISPECIES: hypothetical protein [unclassified Streptomyces]WSQ81037.1 hypothetical protein OG725_29835 [Streptomyces sp. NBC_01213]TXS10347.1 hypothetical protein EAO68_26505 [Streptomyces sp. wa22]WLQ67696.1 hypothetical protein P8A20_30870 [Streptomyces sp. Alt3]WSR05625.1 hypothetical protein OG265_06250 [Streptomyces sp. NBC_01208]WSR51763.1 hypothetical protein OG279_30845 [Streptomyces sp. NBC_01201]
MLAETICSAVSAAGLGIAAITAYRKRFLTATRVLAYSLVPVGLVMTGVVQWASDIAFKPSVWIGFGLLAAAWLLFMTTRAVERRSGSTRKERRAAKAAGSRGAVAPASASPPLTSGAGAAAPQGQPKKKQGAAPGDDFSDIEAILKKHGI